MSEISCPSGPDSVIPWIKCPCGNHWCVIHSQHAYECPCPLMEDWAISPYAEQEWAKLSLPPL